MILEALKFGVAGAVMLVGFFAILFVGLVLLIVTIAKVFDWL